MKVLTRVEDVVKAVLKKSLGLLWSTLDHCVTVLPEPQAKLITHVCLTAGASEKADIPGTDTWGPAPLSGSLWLGPPPTA